MNKVLKSLIAALSPRYSLETSVELLKAALLAQQPPADPPGHLNVFRQDLVEPRNRGGRVRWYKSVRNPDRITTIGFHVTAVNGGFGVARYQMRPWLARWDRALIDGVITDKRPHVEDRRSLVPWIDPEADDPRKAWARLMALRTRYMQLTYHSISSAAGELIINHPPWRTTWHGNGMNGYSWGHSMDDVWSDGEDVPEARVAHEQRVLEGVYRHLYDSDVRPKFCEMHSQHSNKPHDPGNPYITRVVLPFAAAHGLELRPLHHSGKGQPLELPTGVHR